MFRSAAVLLLVGGATRALADPVSLPTGSLNVPQGWVVERHAPGYLGASPHGPRSSDVTAMVLSCTASQPTPQCTVTCDEASIRKNYAPRGMEPTSVSRKGGLLRVDFDSEYKRTMRLSTWTFQRVMCKSSGLVLVMAVSPKRPNAAKEAVDVLTGALKWK